MTLPRSEYGDPLAILEAREKSTCRGCRHFVRQAVFDVVYLACKLDRSKHWQCGWKSQRCVKYDTGESE